jgi:hypothetical protein
MWNRRGLLNLALAAPAAALVFMPLAGLARAPTGPPCGERSAIVGVLGHTYGERLVGSGLSEAGTLFEIYASRGGSWTIIVTKPDGHSCLVGAGQGWETEKPKGFES